MPKRYRECFVRKHYWGDSQKEIAAELGISESAVSAYVSLGKSQLHKKYFTLTLDTCPRAEALHAEDEFLNLLRSGEGLSDNEILDEYQVKAINWRYKEYMRKHANELRSDLFLNDGDFSGNGVQGTLFV